MDVKIVHAALQLAVEVAIDGERATPRLPSPPALHRVLGFRRFSNATYVTIATVLDEDDEFRARVAEAADEERVGVAAMLWLSRPDGWQERFTELATAAEAGEDGRGTSVARLRRERDGAEHAAERAREDADAADAARSRAESRLAEVLADAQRDVAELAALRTRTDELMAERNHAVRELKAVEAALAEARRDLKAARRATVEAEGELAAHRAGAAPPALAKPSVAKPAVAKPEAEALPSFDRPGSPGGPAPSPAADRFDRDAAGRAVAAAADAAQLLAAALADAGRALGGTDADDDMDAEEFASAAWGREHRRGGANSRASGAGRGAGSRRRDGAGDGRGRRRRPRLPFGVVEGTAAADRALVTTMDHVLLIDGYNVARTAWQGLTPEEERRRVVALLEELEARTGVEVVVVFDGRDGTIAPLASRRVRVRFSPTGVTADEVLVDLVEAMPIDRQVVVVSSDREIAVGADAAGAAVVDSAAFLAASGRSPS